MGKHIISVQERGRGAAARDGQQLAAAIKTTPFHVSYSPIANWNSSLSLCMAVPQKAYV